MLPHCMSGHAFQRLHCCAAIGWACNAQQYLANPIYLQLFGFVYIYKLCYKSLGSMYLHCFRVFFQAIYRFAVSLQAWVEILVVVTLKVHYIIILPSKHILIVLNGDSIMIRSQKVGCCQGVTKCKMCEEYAKYAKKMQNE